ncbi:MAG TPA: DUF47 family protein [Chloroflexota bacterium]|nr:DUF47 family protein [Chloroflexota bacterium]
MAFSLVPRERQFFTLFRDDAANLMQGLRTLLQLLQSPGDFEASARALRDLEHRGDEITHHIIGELNRTFITPFDRDDIYALAATLDDILDLAEETADTIVIDRVETIRPEAREMGEILIQIGEELVAAIDHLDTRQDMREHWIRLHELENRGDALTRQAIGALFQEGCDAITLIKWKDIFALLEKTVDRTEDVANILESVAIKNA